MAITAETRNDIIELVITAYNAAPGTDLLTELVAIVDGGGSLADVAANLTTRAEWTSRYPSFQTAEEFANEWLGNLVPEAGEEALAEGVSVAVSLVNGGSSFADILLEAQAFLSATAETDAAFGTSAANWNNKVEVATAHTITNENAGLDADVLSSVTSDDATVTAATDSLAEAAVVPGQSISLTTGLDNGASFTGGANNDTFSAIESNDSDLDTLTTGDSVDGGAGTDRLVVAASGTPAGGTTAGVATANVEELSLFNNSTAAYTLDAALMPGITDIYVNGGANNSTISGVASLPNLHLISTIKNATVTVASGIGTGTADSATVLSNASAQTGSVTATYNGLETINFNAAGTTGKYSLGVTDNTLSLVSSDLETVNVTGDANANITVSTVGAANDTQTSTLDASAAGGEITAHFTKGSSVNVAVTMSAQDDHLDYNGSVAKTATLDGGDGTDVLELDADLAYSSTATTQAGAGISNFEGLYLASGVDVDERALPNNAGITSVIAAAGGSYTKATALATVTQLTSGTFTHTVATDGSADSLTLSQAGAGVASTLSAANVETLTVSSAGTGDNTLTMTAAGSADLTSLTVTGTQSLNASISGTALATVDASGLSGVGELFTLTASASDADMTVTGSAVRPTNTLTGTANDITTGDGDDTVTGGDYNDTIVTGKGDDTITAGDGVNTITSGRGNDVITSGDGDDVIDAGAGDDNITAGDGDDKITTGTGDDTVSAGAGDDLIATASLSVDDSFDGGAGTDRLSTTTGTITSTSAASVNSALIDVVDDVAPTLTGIESLYISINADASASATDYVDLDLTGAADATSLVLETADAEPTKVTNFAGSSIALYGATSGAIESEDLYIDGVGQSAVTLTLHDYDNAADTGQNTFTGIDSLTVKGQSKSVFTGNAAQDNTLGDIVATTAETIAITTTGSDNATDGASALTIDEITGTRATAFNVTVGSFDDLALDGFTASGDLVETSTINVGSDSIFDVEVINFDGSALDTLDIDLGAGSIMNIGGSGTITTAKDVDISADSIASADIDLQAGAEAHLDLSGIEITSSTLDVGSSGTLTLVNSLGAASDTSSFVFSGRGDVDFDDGTGVTLNKVALVGDGVTFNTTGLSVDSDAFTVDGSAGDDVISTALGADALFGAAGEDSLSGGVGADSLSGGAGEDSLTGGDGADEFNYTTLGVITETGISNAVETLSGTFMAGDVLSLTDTTDTGTYTVVAGDSLATIAAGLAAAYNTASSGTAAAASGAAITITSLAATTAAASVSTSITTIADTAVAVSGTTVSGFDTITDYTASDSDLIRVATTLTATTAKAGAATAAAVAATSVSIDSNGLVTFATADDTLAEMVTALAADDTNLADGEVALFVLGSDAYVYFANDTSDDTTDALIKITGGSDLDTLAYSSGDITLS